MGGESGSEARSAQTEWASDVIAQCREVGSAVFVKQLGRNARAASRPLPLRDRAGADPKMAAGAEGAGISSWHLTTRQRKTERAYARRLLAFEETIARGSCIPHILAVADELRARIEDEQLRRSVTAVADICFRSFTP